RDPFMKHLVLPAVALFLMATCFSEEAESAQKKKKKKAEANNATAVAGTIVSVSKGEGSQATSTLTVRVQGAKKKQTTERKFELADGTKYETLLVAKKAFGLNKAAVGDLKAGERVLVQTKEGQTGRAERVILVAGQKKKKAAAE